MNVLPLFPDVALPGRPGRFSVSVEAGRFSEVRPLPETGAPHPALWLCPGFFDLHVHLGWTDFDLADQSRRAPEEIERLRAEAFRATLAAGFTMARDAGGLLPAEAQALRRRYGLPLSVDASGLLLGAADAQKGERFLSERVEEVRRAGCRWLKILATGGLGCPSERVLEPVFSREQFRFLTRRAHERGLRVMVHSWGGETLDWCAEDGADTVEHAVFLTAAQAEKLRRARVDYVPTVAIYRVAADPDSPLRLPDVLCRRAARAARAHPEAVQLARRAGLRLGLGTDFATPALHGQNLRELFALQACGLSPAEAFRAATADSADILGVGDQRGRVRAGFLADAVLFGRDPLAAPDAAALKSAVRAVYVQGKKVRG